MNNLKEYYIVLKTQPRIEGDGKPNCKIRIV